MIVRLAMVHFEPIAQQHRVLLMAWLSAPHARAWWGEPKEQVQLIYDNERTGESQGFIASIEGEPFAYVQCWACEAQSAEAMVDAPWLADQAPGTMGIDITIGPPNMLGKGLGSLAVRALADRLFADGVPRVIIDPDAENLRAVRAYEKAGFSRFDSYTNRDGQVTLLMERFPSSDTVPNPAQGPRTT